MATIEIANTDPILDPSFAEHQAKRAFADHFQAVGELRDYGRDLIKRLMTACVNSLPDLVVVGGLLRHLVVSIDGWHVCATNGAAQAARVHLRGVFEAHLYIEWILAKGKEHWARQLYVANVRSMRVAARRSIPGTEEHRLLSEAWEQSFGHPYSQTPETVEAARKQDGVTLDTLELPVYDHIYRDFEAAVANRKREPHWYEVGPDAVSSIFSMATELGKRAEYYILYEMYSDAAHGYRTDLHFRKTPDKGVLLEPVRNPAELVHDAGLAVSLPVRTFLLLLEHYRPEERAVFVQQHASRWREYMDSPRIEVNVRPVGPYSPSRPPGGSEDVA